MNFAQFLRSLRTQKSIATAKEHFEKLGGDQTLGISLRHYQQIEAGKYPPSEKILAALFAKLPQSDRKTVILAYFRSILESNPDGKPLIEYLEQHLLPSMETDSKSIWESNRRLMIYSESQLEFLTHTPEALRLHKRVLLLEDVPVAASSISKKTLEEMKDLDLVEVKAGKIQPSRTLYRLPHYDNSNPRAVAKATDYILRHIDLYASREGSPKQEISYAAQMLRPAVAERVLDQLRTFKRWVQSLATNDPDPDTRPFVFVGFAKLMENKDL